MNFIVEMGTRCKTGGTDVSDNITLSDSLAAPDSSLEALEMSIRGCVPVRMTDANVVTIAPQASRSNNRSTAGSHNWRALRCAEIKPPVHFTIPGDWMPTHAIAGCDSGTVNRCLD